MRESQIFNIAKSASILLQSELIKYPIKGAYDEILAIEAGYLPRGTKEIKTLTLKELVTNPTQWVSGTSILFLSDSSGKVLSQKDIDSLDRHLTYQAGELSRAVFSLGGLNTSLSQVIKFFE